MARALSTLLIVAALAAAAAAAAEARAVKLTPSENRWAVPEVSLMKSLSGRVGAVRFIVDDPTVLDEGSAARKKLRATLREVALCGERLKRNGQPPTARLRPFYVALRSACSYYATGAVELIAGVAKPDAALIRSSKVRLQNGSKLLALAQSRLLQLTA